MLHLYNVSEMSWYITIGGRRESKSKQGKRNCDIRSNVSWINNIRYSWCFIPFHAISIHFIAFSYYFTTFHSIFAFAKFCYPFPVLGGRCLQAWSERGVPIQLGWGKDAAVGWGWDATGKWMTFKSCASCILDFLDGKKYRGWKDMVSPRLIHENSDCLYISYTDILYAWFLFQLQKCLFLIQECERMPIHKSLCKFFIVFPCHPRGWRSYWLPQLKMEASKKLYLLANRQTWLTMRRRGLCTIFWASLWKICWELRLQEVLRLQLESSLDRGGLAKAVLKLRWFEVPCVLPVEKPAGPWADQCFHRPRDWGDFVGPLSKSKQPDMPWIAVVCLVRSTETEKWFSKISWWDQPGQT